jgi:glucose/mannose-6-phosphate isomerase
MKGKNNIMGNILDSLSVLRQKDPSGALDVVAKQYQQVLFDAPVWHSEHDDREITGVVVTGMGGSALAALLAKVWLGPQLSIPFEVVRGYELPAYVSRNTLVIVSSYSGNTEETLSALEQAEERGSQIGILASGGKLIGAATQYQIAHVSIPDGLQPRMAVLYNLKGLVALLETFSIVHNASPVLEGLSGWLGQESAQWGPDVPLEQNYAKQLAEQAVGKTPVFYGSPLTAPVAYKWKISWNEDAKNVAFWNEYPEFNHNEFLGWVSHPVEKPFAVFDITSSFDHPRVSQRFVLSDKLLSGKRPKATTIELRGDTVLAQLLWGSILADHAAVYVAILNGVDPTPVDLIEKFKKELG